ncbi:MAG: branched-chain amino acid ABC transporter permease [Alphaproteobacteria bacterium]|nr:branched-chain amino acid ABC transporter permease [Alphaproteobacteria bacterium]
MMDILPSILTPVLVNCIAVVGLYVIAASGRISAGHAAFFGIGGYASGLTSIHLAVPPLLSVALGMVVAALVGAAFALIADRLSHWFFAVATLAFAVMVLSLVSTVDALGGATGLYGIPIAVGLGEVAGALILAVGFAIWLDSTDFGRTMRAVRDSEPAARALAINPTYVRCIAYALGTGLAGAAGGLWSHYLGLIKPGDMSLDRSLLYLIYLSIGGIEHWIGALLGTFLLDLLPEFIRFSRGYRFALFGGLLALVMVLRPSGIVGRAEVDKVKVAWTKLRRFGLTRRSSA